MEILVSILKSFGRLVFCLLCMFYDFFRFTRYGGWRQNMRNKQERNYASVRVYHSLEKSLSLTERNPSAGGKNAKLLKAILDRAKEANDYGFQDRVALKVLSDFTAQIVDKGEGMKLHRELQHISDEASKEGGILEIKNSILNLENPEEFFLGRHSIREFSDLGIKDTELKRAIHMAMKAPSVCNRQAWYIYDLENPEVISAALSLQNGNRGFGHKVKRLLIICSDLEAFVSYKERYQHWIDGGIFSMSMILALHSIGIGSCCLNWSQDAATDLKLRKLLPINPEHSVIMMLAIGYPNDTSKVCQSPRRPIEEIYTKL
ncbi:nitroreductase [Halomonas sp. KO116]|nr:nitroreductase [Halomonas sp. KO116]|tara:strand:+ start:4972 stop:5925 length:954 start_codon:yes stop_codon:yes gene_type:complete